MEEGNFFFFCSRNDLWNISARDINIINQNIISGEEGMKTRTKGAKDEHCSFEETRSIHKIGSRHVLDKANRNKL